MTSPNPARGHQYDKTVNDGGQLHQGDVHGDVHINHYHGAENLLQTDPRDNKKQIERDSGGLLREPYKWILENSQFQAWRDKPDNNLLWLEGDAGTGKTLSLCGIIDELLPSSKLANKDAEAYLSFFLARDGSPLMEASSVLRGLIHLILEQQPDLNSHLQRKYKAMGAQLYEGSRAFDNLSTVLSDMLQDPRLSHTYLVVDAVDRCSNELLDFIASTAASSSAKWAVSSRPNSSVRFRLHRYASIQEIDLGSQENVLHLSRAVDVYIDRVVSGLPMAHDDPKLQKQLCSKLKKRSEGTFLWVSHIVRKLQVADSWDVETVMAQVPESLLEVYVGMLKDILQLTDNSASHCGSFLSLVATARRRLCLEELGVLGGLPKDVAENPKSITKMVRLCGFLTIRDDKTVYPIHSSAEDFFSKQISSYRDAIKPGSPFWRNVLQDKHKNMLTKSLAAMSTTLRRDIYNLRWPGISTEEVKKPDPDPLASLQYSLTYWCDHLGKLLTFDSKGRLVHGAGYVKDDGPVHNFIKEHLLHWLEALILCGTLQTGTVMLATLEQVLATPFLSSEREGSVYPIRGPMPAEPRKVELYMSSSYRALIREANRFLVTFQSCIETYPLQIYHAVLIFTPASSSIRRKFRHELPRWIRSPLVINSQWNPLRATLEGHQSNVLAQAFSLCTRRLASADDSGIIRVWDVHTRECLGVLETGDRGVLCISFWNPDLRLVVASIDGSVRIWCLITSTMLVELKDKGRKARSAAFSRNGRQLAFGYNDGTIVVQTISKAKKGFVLSPLVTLREHTGAVRSMAFSGDCQHLVSAASDHSIRKWNLTGYHYSHTLDSPTQQALSAIVSPLSVAYSPDHSKVAAVLSNGTVQTWYRCPRKSVLTPRHTLGVNADLVATPSFSADGRWLAAISSGNAVCIFDTNCGVLQNVLYGHHASVSSAIFSPDDFHLASVSKDATVRLWDRKLSTLPETRTRVPFSSTEVPGDALREGIRVIMSPDTQRLKLAYVQSYGTTQLLRVEASVINQTLTGCHRSRRAITLSPDGRKLALTTSGGEVELWAVDQGTLHRSFRGPDGEEYFLAFSSDSKLLVSAASVPPPSRRQRPPRAVRVWNTATGEPLDIGGGQVSNVSFVTFMPNSREVLTLSTGRWQGWWGDKEMYTFTVTLLGPGGPGQREFKLRQPEIYAAAISPDGQNLALATVEGTVGLWDVVTEEMEREFVFDKGSSDEDVDDLTESLIAFSSDGGRLAVGLLGGEHTVWLWDLKTMACLQVFQGHKTRLCSVIFSFDGKRLVSMSDDKAVRVWDVDASASFESKLVDPVSRLSLTDDPLAILGEEDRDLGGSVTPVSEEMSNDANRTNSAVQEQETHESSSWGLSSDKAWITWEGKAVLWLPSSYSPVETVIRGNSVSFRCSSGAKLDVKFSEDARKYLGGGPGNDMD